MRRTELKTSIFARVQKWSDIAQPTNKQFNEEDNEDEDTHAEESRFLDKNLAVHERKKATGTRTALLTLSTGPQELQAMEDRPIQCQFAVGMLLQISAPIEVRKGILMLNATNTKALYCPPVAAKDEQ